MNFARLGNSLSIAFVDIRPPFSNFQFVDALLSNNDCSAVRRLFSQARRDGMGKTLILEDIEAFGAVAEENAELATLFPGHQCRTLKRLTFWGRPCASVGEMENLTGGDLLGYGIIKEDVVPNHPPYWHIFESVFRKYRHKHNCVPEEPAFEVLCGARVYRMQGVMYCQQNGLNKSCAHVALRSLLSRIHTGQDIAYGEMNGVARKRNPALAPGDGLTSEQIRDILEHYGVTFDDYDYTASPEPPIPYSKPVYAGVENGLGALLGFELAGSDAHGERHIIPFFGHTFNQDTWVPRASLAYFHVGDNTRYISSEEWMSSFIGHDDNFGSNYCVPRRFLKPGQVKYVAALRPSATAYGAVSAEAIAVDSLYSAMGTLVRENNYWIKRLVTHIKEQDVVLRAVYLAGENYVRHLRKIKDWDGHGEDPAILDSLEDALPKNLWMVEVSIPELFSANYRKLGEMVLDACVPMIPYPPTEPVWLISRFPGLYLINENRPDNPVSYSTVESAVTGHTPLFSGLNEGMAEEGGAM